MTSEQRDHFPVCLPDPGRARVLSELIQQLRLLKIWAGDPSYENIKDRINAAWTLAGRPSHELTKKATVVDCFKASRRRLNSDLVLAIVLALNPNPGYQTQWRQALRVVTGEVEAAAQVRALDRLPEDLPTFSGRSSELARIRALTRRAGGEVLVISAIEGMAGVGKTQLAIRAGHLLSNIERFEHVLFVNLRGFHPDPAQPPADPSAVLDSFLRLLGVPGHQVPHDLLARSALYRKRLAGRRALVVLDDAVDESQVEPLLPQSPHCVTLVTSRRRLTDLRVTSYLPLDVFTAGEARDCLVRIAPEIVVGEDPTAVARIAGYCGYLPLALSLVAGHARTRPDWTWSDHAMRLGQLHQDGRLDVAVERALTLSYQYLPSLRQHMFRLLALHPGQDVDRYAAAALSNVDENTADEYLDQLCADHLLQQSDVGRFVFHDLVRAYANDRAGSEDRPAVQRDALTRLFDYYLATAAAAMDTLHPTEARRRPNVEPPATPMPPLTDPDAATAWFDKERSNLAATAAHTAAHNWHAHTVRLSGILYQHLEGGHPTEALTIHGHARNVAHLTGESYWEAQALSGLGVAHWQLGHHELATDHHERSLEMSRRADDRAGEARALNSLGVIEQRVGRYGSAADLHRQAFLLYQQIGDVIGEARTQGNLGIVEERLGRYAEAQNHYGNILILFQRLGDRAGAARTLNNLGVMEGKQGQYRSAREHLEQALALCRTIGARGVEADVLDSIGVVLALRGQPDQAAKHHQEALAIFHDLGAVGGEAEALNGLGEAACATGKSDAAVTYHANALALSLDAGTRHQQARAHAGLGRAYSALNERRQACHHYQLALAIQTELGTPEAVATREQLAALDADRSSDSTHPRTPRQHRAAPGPALGGHVPSQVDGTSTGP